MGAKRGQSYTAELKAKVVLEALRGDMTLNEISTKYRVHTTQINRWKQQAISSIKAGFTGKQEKRFRRKYNANLSAFKTQLFYE